MKLKTLRNLSILMLMLLSVQVAFAKEVTQITLSGPLLNGEVEVKDKVDFDALLDLVYTSIFTPRSERPTVGTDSYLIKIAYGDGEGSVVATAVVRYYPGLEGKPGNLYYEDFIGGSSTHVGRWATIQPTHEQALQTMLNKFGISLAPDGTAVQAKSQPAQTGASSVPSQIDPMLVAAVIGLSLVMIALTVVRSMRQSAVA